MAKSTVNMLRGNPHGLVDETRVEVDIGVELAFLEVVIVQRGLLKLLGDLQKIFAPGLQFEDLVGVLFDDCGAGIIVAVDAVAEAHELDAVLTVLDLFDELLGREVVVTNELEHLDDGLVGSAVFGAGQGIDSGGDGGVQVGA